LLLNLLLKKGYLNYDRLHLYSKSLQQEKYFILRDWFAGFEQTAGKELASFHSAAEEIMPVESLDKKERSLMIFDDVMLEKQGPIEKWRGRLLLLNPELLPDPKAGDSRQC
jgi:hypothetical protein